MESRLIFYHPIVAVRDIVESVKNKLHDKNERKINKIVKIESEI